MYLKAKKGRCMSEKGSGDWEREREGDDFNVIDLFF